MTKPIEGWVAQGIARPDLVQFFTEKVDADRAYGNDKRFTLRPVKITFTDELDTVVKYKRLDELRNEKDIPQPVVEKEIADAIKKERERIWDIIEDEVVGNDWINMEELRGRIFMEEK